MDGKSKTLINIAISVLSAALTVLMVIPGNQGESILQIAIQMLKQLIGG